MLQVAVITLGGVIIGYSTNAISIKMLFWPREKVLGMQGVIPARKEELAGKVASFSINMLPGYLQFFRSIPLLGSTLESNIREAVIQNVREMNDEEFEKVAYKIARKSFRFIRIMGGVLGGAIAIGSYTIMSII